MHTEKKMKKRLLICVAILIGFFVFSTLSFKTKAESEVKELWRVEVIDNRPIVGADAGDVDGDGIEDIAIIASEVNTLQVIKSDGTGLWNKNISNIFGNVAIEDIDLDGKGEVFVFGGIDTPTLLAFDDDGAELWPSPFEKPVGRPRRFTFIGFLNLDADPELEIFLTPGGEGACMRYFTHCAVDTDGLELWNFTADETAATMAFTDVTGGGVEEIILASFTKIYVLDKNGTLLQKQSIHSGLYGGHIAAGDVTGDGIDDLAISCHPYLNTLYVLKNDLTPIWNRTYNSGTYYNISTPLMIDVDCNGIKDVVVYGGGEMHAYRGSDGAESWAFGNSSFLPEYTLPLHFDINRDSLDEIVFQKDEYVYALSLNDGSIALDFSLPNSGTLIQLPNGGHVEGCETPRHGIVADVNADGFDELIVQEIINDQICVAVIVPPTPNACLYYDLLDKYTELLSKYNLLNRTCQELLGNITDLQEKYDSLSTTVNDLQEQINLLNSMLQTSVSELQEQHNSLNSTLALRQETVLNELGNIRNLMYVLTATTVILVATTVYVAIRKPKTNT